jgi:uncharacterized membrane protein HdeD (DUF308 family)
MEIAPRRPRAAGVAFEGRKELGCAHCNPFGEGCSQEGSFSSPVPVNNTISYSPAIIARTSKVWKEESMSAASAISFAKESVGWSIALSVLMIVAGIFAIALPVSAGFGVELFVAWLLIFSGCAHFVFAWHTRSAGGFVWESLLGVLYVVTGIYLLMHPVAGLASLTLALAIYLLLEASLEFAMGFAVRPLRGWGWLMVDGVITLILALLIWRTWPSSTEWVIGTLVGISMLFSGVSRLGISLAARSVTAKLGT